MSEPLTIVNYVDLPFVDPNDLEFTPEEIEKFGDSLDRFISDGSDITVIYVPEQDPEPKQN